MIAIILMIGMLDHRQIQLFDTPDGGAPTNIFAATSDREGNLYALDVAEKCVLVWNREGHFQRRFGRPGNGPGEFNNPVQITVDDFIYVWDTNKIVVFQKTGAFVRHLRVAQIMPKRFIVLNQNELLIGFRELKNGTVYARFEKRNRHTGDRGRTLRTIVNHGFERTEYGEANATINAYMPDLDLQVSEQGTFIGFGGEPYLYQIDRAGDTVKKFAFDIPTRPPNAAEKERYLNMTFPVPGGHVAIKDLPQLVVRFDQAKAYWTQFTIKAGRVAFLRTPIGSFDSIGDGYHQGEFFINDLTTGTLLERGHLQLPEDSQVYLRDGHVIAAIAGEDGFNLTTLQLKGFPL